MISSESRLLDNMLTPWRSGLYEEIKRLDITGLILDLGGSRKSGYHELVGGAHTFTVANMDETVMDADGGRDFRLDLEKPLPMEYGSYDAVMAFNVFEHVYNYRSLLDESRRVLKDRGQIFIGVPFLIQVHPSPHDYWRYTEETLRLVLAEAGFCEIEITAVGRGPFTASAQILNNALSFSCLRAPFHFCMRILDMVAGCFKSRQSLAKEYVLGYFVRARK